MHPDAMKGSIYLPLIMEHANAPYHYGRCPACTHSDQEDNSGCGDMIHVEVHVDNTGTLRDIYFHGDACCFSRATASMLANKMEGRSLDDILQLSAEDVLGWIGTDLPPTRRECVLLPWRALLKVVNSAS